MAQSRTLKQEFVERFTKSARHALVVGDKAFAEFQKDAADLLTKGQTIIFSGKQAEVFRGLAAGYTDTLDYRLPFPLAFLQFDIPVNVRVPHKGNLRLSSLFLIQFYDKSEGDGALNMAHAWFTEPGSGKDVMMTFRWMGLDLPMAKDQETLEGTLTVQALAIACIGYINCENIYLHKEGEVPAKVNRKREQQGKKILEPYYVCRIRGVQYDSNGEPTGQGTHHGFRYDVRGHFRRLDSGKTTWVRPHQRGLQNELYIPKTYVVEKGAKPAA